MSDAQALPPLVQNTGVPFDLLIQALTEQLDKAQASMALKARVGRLPMTFAVKDVSLDLRAFVSMVDDDIYLRPAGPGDAGASSIKLALTTITRSMVEENAVNFQAEDPKFSLREALGDRINPEDQRSLERIGVRSIGQLNELRQAAGADVVARLARMPVNRLQQAMLAASAPRVTRVEQDPAPVKTAPVATRAPLPQPTRLHIEAPLLRPGRLPLIQAGGTPVPVVQAQDQTLVLQPLAHQLGTVAEVDFGDGQVAAVKLTDGSVGAWKEAAT
ncbi:hypothetical protein HHL11_10645 [Ramlibacter sp. G-1-2-2]|uniref:Uncharacterized protein n=1 Tax=Ramlibacter agri TaxID=2728837 RepID=A0A848H3W6_9BURK|nr:hypothetical protein [Ramlibacter agri]NML44209.1 hypothetical protein [Ramlibacter agri]